MSTHNLSLSYSTVRQDSNLAALYYGNGDIRLWYEGESCSIEELLYTVNAGWAESALTSFDPALPVVKITSHCWYVGIGQITVLRSIDAKKLSELIHWSGIRLEVQIDKQNPQSVLKPSCQDDQLEYVEL